MQAIVGLHAAPDSRVWDNATFELNPLDPVRLALDANERAARGDPGAPNQVGLTRAIPGGVIDPAIIGQWSTTADGSNVWRLKIQSPGALALRVHFQNLDLPDGAIITIAGADGVAHPFKGLGPAHGGGMWSPSVEGETAFIEYVAPQHVGLAPIIDISEVAHAFRPLGTPQAVALGANLNCELDATCFNVNTLARDAVGQMNYIENGGQYICSGTLLNDIDSTTQIPWFLTAHHCIDTQAAATTLEVVWLYQTPTCNGIVPNYNTRPRSYGATLLATSGQTDFTLMRLSQQPPNGVGYAGWTTNAASGQLISVHHPAGSWKRYTRYAVNSARPYCSGLDIANFFYLDFVQGTVEGGSSGSPLINTNGEVVGQLFGTCGNGGDMCSTFPRAVYGRFAISYNLGNLAQYLFAEPVIDDAYEDNDTFGNAATITAGAYNLVMRDDQDFFKITLAQGGRLDIQAEFNKREMDLDLELLNSFAGLIDSSVTTQPLERITRVLAPGTYYIHTYRYAGDGGDYTLNISFEDEVTTDLDNDGVVAIDDVILVLMSYGDTCNAPPSASCPDVSGNGVTDVADIAIVLRDLGYRRAEYKKKEWQREMKTLYEETISPLIPTRTSKERKKDLQYLKKSNP